jgi:tRNA pseudouridine38-40 synthase
MRYRLTIAYDGTHFAGWQRQLMPADAAAEHGHTTPPGDDGRVELRTVQGEVMRAVSEVVRETVDVQGASRTDSGVHARFQTAAFTVPDGWKGPPIERMAMAINAKLPPDILVTDCVRVDDAFNPIADCIAKGYRYALHVGRTRPLWDRHYVAHMWEERLDVDAMQAAAPHLIGTHDFEAFATAGHGRESTVRTVTACTVEEKPCEQPGCQRIDIDVAADGFLYNMVRIIAGTLYDVGRGKTAPEDIPDIIASRDRRRAGQTMPPMGLCLMWGEYPGQ